MPLVWYMSAALRCDPCGEFPPSEHLRFLWWDRPLPFSGTLFKTAKVEVWLTFISGISWCSRKLLSVFLQVEPITLTSLGIWELTCQNEAESFLQRSYLRSAQDNTVGKFGHSF